MAYTFMVMSRDDTSRRAWTFTVSKFVFWLCVILLFSAPVAVYFGTFQYVAPRVLGADAAAMAADLQTAGMEIEDLRELNRQQLDEIHTLKADLSEFRQSKAAAEARTAILENSRANTSSRLSGLEDEVYNLRRAVEFYEALLKPATDKELVQCFNIKADYTPKSKSVKYYVNFLKTDNDNKKRVVADVKYRILTGRSALALDTAEGAEVLHNQELSMMKDIRLSGTINKELPEDGLRIFDVKAYTSNGDVLAHCWKAF